MFLACWPTTSVGQVARLDPRGGVEVDLRALDRGGHDRPRRGVDRALGLLAQQRRERRQERRERGRAAGCRRASCSPRGPTGSDAASGRRGARGSTPSRPGRAPRGSATSSSTRPFSCASAGLKRVPWQQDVHQRGLDAEHPDDAGDAAAAGQQAERRLGQAELDLAVVDDDPVVAGQRDLEAAAERGAVDRGDDRLRKVSSRRRSALMRLDLAKTVGASSGVAWIISLRLPPAKKVFLALATTTPVTSRPARRTAGRPRRASTSR